MKTIEKTLSLLIFLHLAYCFNFVLPVSIYAQQQIEEELITYYPSPSCAYRDLYAVNKLWVLADHSRGAGAGLLQVGRTSGYPCVIYGYSTNAYGASGYGLIGVYGETKGPFNDAISAESNMYIGAYGYSVNGNGIFGQTFSSDMNMPAVRGDSIYSRGINATSMNDYYLHGYSMESDGIFGETFAQTVGSAHPSGIHINTLGDGIIGSAGRVGYGIDAESQSSCGIYAHSVSSQAVFAESSNNTGLYGITNNSGSPTYLYSGVYGKHNYAGKGVKGMSGNSHGIKGESVSSIFSPWHAGVVGDSTGGCGIVADSDTSYGLYVKSTYSTMGFPLIRAFGYGGYSDRYPAGGGICVFKTSSSGYNINAKSNGRWGIVGITGAADKPDIACYVYGTEGDFTPPDPALIQATVAYYFTGAHLAEIKDPSLNIIPGMIVVIADNAVLESDSLDNIIPKVDISSYENDNRVLGAYAYVREEKGLVVVNALGEGLVWVTDINGDIENGDYITTSFIPGYGQRQDDDSMYSYTVGKAIESINWADVNEYIEFSGKKFKKYLLAITYHCG